MLCAVSVGNSHITFGVHDKGDWVRDLVIRKSALDSEGILSLLILVGYAAAFFLYGSARIRKYSE